MKAVYPILIKDCGDCFIVFAPDWDTATQGYSLYEAITMGRDAISLLAICKEDENEEFPIASDYAGAREKAVNSDWFEDVNLENAITTYVDIDTDEYRKQLDEYE